MQLLGSLVMSKVPDHDVCWVLNIYIYTSAYKSTTPKPTSIASDFLSSFQLQQVLSHSPYTSSLALLDMTIFLDQT